jgi:hypothetical protein
MPTLGWWRAGVRVPALAPPPLSSAPSGCHGQDLPLQHVSSSSPSEMAAAAPAASSGAAPATPWMSSMDLEADGARYYELTNYNILHESTWGGREGAGDRLRAILRPRTPLLLPASPPLPLSRESAVPRRLQNADERAASGSSRENLKSVTSAGLSKVLNMTNCLACEADLTCVVAGARRRQRLHHTCSPRSAVRLLFLVCLRNILHKQCRILRATHSLLAASFQLRRRAPAPHAFWHQGQYGRRRVLSSCWLTLTLLLPGAKHDPSEYLQALRIRSVDSRCLLIILIPPCFS